MWDQNVALKIEVGMLRAENAELMYENEKLGIVDKKLDELSLRLEKSRESHKEALQILKEWRGVQ
jgi:hypothetical protein